jgi:SAM-dependent methyltransferase
MSLADEYRLQLRWRPWKLILGELPLQPGQNVLDLGCGIGDQARELAARGCRVIGFDANQELVDTAMSQKLRNCEFRTCDLRNLPQIDTAADGIWSSFAAAYFTNLTEVLSQWAQLLKAGGWMAITEIDNLFGHEPLSVRTQSLLQAYVEDALNANRYDFRMGAKLEHYVTQAGFAVSRVLPLPDQELCFRGPAAPEVVVAWQKRFDRMTMLRNFCGSEFAKVREEFLFCITRPDHFSTAKVVSCIAMKAK